MCDVDSSARWQFGHTFLTPLAVCWYHWSVPPVWWSKCGSSAGMTSSRSPSRPSRWGRRLLCCNFGWSVFPTSSNWDCHMYNDGKWLYDALSGGTLETVTMGLTRWNSMTTLWLANLYFITTSLFVYIDDLINGINCVSSLIFWIKFLKIFFCIHCSLILVIGYSFS